MDFNSSDFFMGVKGLIISLIGLYKWVVVIRVLISWLNPDPYNPIVQFLRSVTDPAIEGLRRMLPRFLWSSGLDFTPLVLILLLQIAMTALNSFQF